MPRLTTLVLGFIAAILCGSLSVSTASAASQPTAKSFNKMPLSFTKNMGQWDNRVLFRANSGGATMWFTKEGVTYQLTRRISGGNPDNRRGTLHVPAGTRSVPLQGAPQLAVGHDPFDRFDDTRDSIEQLVLTAKFIDANPNPEVTAEGQMEYKCNYFLGNDPSKWHTNVPNYEAITIKDIYPGIDLKYSGDGTGQAVYEFIAAPGDDVAQIKVEYEGAEETSIDSDGVLILKTKWGDVIAAMKSPANGVLSGTSSYSQLSDKTIGFDAKGASRQALGTHSIELSYSTFLDGPSTNEWAYSIAVDDSGCAYVTGVTWSWDFPTQNPFDASFNGGDGDVFVTKLSPAGNSLVYSTFLGGSSRDKGYGIAVDDSGCAYVTGETSSTDFPTQNAYDASNPIASTDVFVTKLSAAGNSLGYSTYLGGSYYADAGNGIAVDDSGCAHVTGRTRSRDFPTYNAFDASFGGDVFNDCFVTKFSAAGNLLIYSTYLGGSSEDWGSGIAIDDSGYAYVTGSTFSVNFPVLNPYQTHHGSYDAFVTKLSSSGNKLVYSTYLGGSEVDWCNGIAVDHSGSVYLAGQTRSADFPTQSAFDASLNSGDGWFDAFLAKLSASGSSLVYSTFLGGSSNDGSYAIAVDDHGCAYVTGQTGSPDFPTLRSYQPHYDSDVFVTKFSDSGSRLVYSTFLGGYGGSEYGYGIAVDNSGGVYVTGSTNASDFPTHNAFDSSANGYVAFVTKIAPLQHDASVRRIVVPDSCVGHMSTLSPQALVCNEGENADVVPVVFEIGSIYCDTSEIFLTPRDSGIVTFANWSADSVGSFSITCFTALATDEDHGNDTLTSVVAVVADSTAPYVLSVTPNHGGNVGSVSAIIVGGNFHEGAIIRLEREGAPGAQVDSLHTFVLAADTIAVVFDLRGVATGDWDVVVTNHSGTAGRFIGAFSVEPGIEQVWANTVGRDPIRIGRASPFQLTLGNSGNVDIENAIVIITGSSNAKLYSNAPNAFPTDARDSASSSIAFTLSYLRMGASGAATFNLIPSSVGSISIKTEVWVSPPSPLFRTMNDSPNQSAPIHSEKFRSWPDDGEALSLQSCYWCPPAPPEGSVIFQDDVGSNPRTGHEGIIWKQPGPGGEIYVWENLPPKTAGPSDPGGTRLTSWEEFCSRTYRQHPPNFLIPCCGWQDSYDPRLSTSEKEALHDWLLQHTGAGSKPWIDLFYKCTEATHEAFRSIGHDLIPWREHRWWDAPSLDYVLLKGIPWWGSNSPIIWQVPGLAADALRGDLPLTATLMVLRMLRSIGSIDPNDKAASEGYDTLAHFVPLTMDIDYMVYFENVDSATADAENIIIADTLSASLDWGTLQFGDIFPGAGPDSIRPNFNYTTDFDESTGIITWTLENINLPPDTMPYWGEGWVSYSVRPKSSLPSGTRIENIAAIKFDENPWILAPMDSVPVFNTIDAGTPASSVNGLPDTTRGSQFRVQWSGADEPNGSGIESYSIYVSTDNGPYNVWISNTTVDTATYQGAFGHSYSFYSIARDNVGHVEAKLPTSEAGTTVTYLCGDADGSSDINIADAVYLISYIFSGGPAPSPLEASDADCSGSINIVDCVYLINFIFRGGAAPCAGCK